ncbi:MAG: hypothetical protein ACOCQQ_01535 [Candidatus Nanoarchaeia archaeon]
MRPSQDKIKEVHDEIAREAKSEERHKHNNKLPKIFKNQDIIKGILGIITLVLIISVFLITPHSQEIIGRIGTTQIQEGIIQAQNISILFTNKSSTSMNDLYTTFQEEQGVEMAACMIGSVHKNTYTISQIHIPHIVSQEWNHVSFASCPSETIIWFHTHPKRKCVPSDTDYYTLEKIQRQNSDAIMMIMCEDNRFRIIK